MLPRRPPRPPNAPLAVLFTTYDTLLTLLRLALARAGLHDLYIRKDWVPPTVFGIPHRAQSSSHREAKKIRLKFDCNKLPLLQDFVAEFAESDAGGFSRFSIICDGSHCI